MNRFLQILLFLWAFAAVATLEGAGGIGGLLARSQLNHPTAPHAYYHADGSGNITALINQNQQVVARYNYSPFGSIINQSGYLADANAYRFSSKEYHAPSGLSYYLHRFYDPSLQRWVNEDPIGEAGGINLYQFCFNNSLSYVDSDGRVPLLLLLPTLAEGVAYGVGALAAYWAAQELAEEIARNNWSSFCPASTANAGNTGRAQPMPYPDLGLISINAPPSISIPISVPNSWNPAADGYWPGPSGAAEWGRRNGVNPRDARNRFHDTKKSDPMSRPRDDYYVNPDTGDVADPKGECIGNLGD